MIALSKKEEEAFSIREFMNNSALTENVVENGARPHFLSFFLTLILDSRFNIYLDILEARNLAKINMENFEE